MNPDKGARIRPAQAYTLFLSLHPFAVCQSAMAGNKFLIRVIDPFGYPYFQPITSYHRLSLRMMYGFSPNDFKATCRSQRISAPSGDDRSYVSDEERINCIIHT
jgi:hypothetical protein